MIRYRTYLLYNPPVTVIKCTFRVHADWSFPTEIHRFWRLGSLPYLLLVAFSIAAFVTYHYGSNLRTVPVTSSVCTIQCTVAYQVCAEYLFVGLRCYNKSMFSIGRFLEAARLCLDVQGALREGEWIQEIFLPLRMCRRPAVDANSSQQPTDGM